MRVLSSAGTHQYKDQYPSRSYAGAWESGGNQESEKTSDSLFDILRFKKAVSRWTDALTAVFTEGEKKTAYALLSRMSENAREYLKDYMFQRRSGSFSVIILPVRRCVWIPLRPYGTNRCLMFFPDLSLFLANTLSQRRRRAKGQAGCVDYFLEVP